MTASGYKNKSSFAALGSGSLQCIACLEEGFKDGMTAKEAQALLTRGISAGIEHDMGSGSNVDVVILTRNPSGGVTREVKRNVKIGASRVQPPLVYDFAPGTTRKYLFEI